MTFEQFIGSQSLIISMDVDHSIFDKIRQLANAGFSMIEINSSDPELLAQAVKLAPDMSIGAGNIVDTQQLENCYTAGVSFATSPGFLPAIAHTANIYSMNYLPGVATVSEAMQVMALGIQQVRPYPADLAFCNRLNKCLPHLRLYPADIEWEDAEHYLTLPSVKAVSIHNPNLKELDAYLNTAALSE